MKSFFYRKICAPPTFVLIVCCFCRSLFILAGRRLSSKTKRQISEEEQEFFDSMELNIQRKQVKTRARGGGGGEKRGEISARVVDAASAAVED